MTWFRMCRTLAAISTWRPPPGVELTVGLTFDPIEVSVLMRACCAFATLTGPMPPAARRQIHRALDAIAAEALARRDEVHAAGDRMARRLSDAERDFSRGLKLRRLDDDARD